MSISDEDMKKFVETVKEMHEMYTKSLERENEGLRNALAETQKRLDEANEVIKNNLKNNSNEVLDEFKKQWGKLNPPSTTPWIQPTIQPYVDPNQYPLGGWGTHPYIQPATWGVSGGSTMPMNATAMGNVAPSDKLSDTIGKQYSNFISGSDDC